MPNTLTTDWIRVGRSGPTVDGRVIEPEWLHEAAETYDPVEVYRASMWPDHKRWYSMGTVEAVKAVDTDEGVDLYTKLCPNDTAIAANKAGQKMFLSMELPPNFADSGKHYLFGLGLTDEPASRATSQLHFSHNGESQDCFIGEPVELGELLAATPKESYDSKLVQALSGALRKLGFNIPNNQGATPEPEEDAMNAEQFNEMMGAIKSINDRQEKLEQQFSQLKPEQDKDGKGTDTGAAPDEGKQNFSAEIAEAMKPFSDKLDGIQTEFTAKVDELNQRFEQANPGTKAPETKQPADGAKLL